MHLTDPSLATASLGMTADRCRNDLNTFGFIFESMCERDLEIYSQSFGANLLHYRDFNGVEIDSVVEMPDGRWGAFEIKLGHRQVDDAAGNLIAVSDMMESRKKGSGPSVLCVICGTEKMAYRREDGVYVVPISLLGP